MTKYIAFDSETGGLDCHKNPILTAYFAALDKDLNILGELDLLIRPDAQYPFIDPGAMEVNKIDLEAHNLDPRSLSRQEAGMALQAFLAKYGGKNSRDKNRPKPLGHNVGFDLGFKGQIIAEQDWSKHVHYSSICTKVITDFFKDCGIFPDHVGNLGSLVKYFNIKERPAHNAKEDTLMMIDVYGKIMEVAKSFGSGSSISLDLLSMLEK